MKWHPLKLWPLLREAARKWNSDNCIRLGASLSYYTIFSLFPLILVTLTIIRLLFINSDAAQTAILDALGSVTGGFREDFATTLEAAIKTRGASGVVGTVLLILGSSWVFGELVSAFNIIWGVQPPQRGGPLQFLRTTFFSFALVLAGVFLLVVSMIISAVLAAIGTFVQAALPASFWLWQIAHTITTLAVFIGVFALLLKFVPQTYVGWQDVWLGATLTAILWTVLQYAISYYIALSSYKDYGAVGAILALVAWVYLSSQVLFFGGEFTVVYAHHFGSRIGLWPSNASPAQAEAIAGARRRVAATHATPTPLVSSAAGITIGVLGTLGVMFAAVLFSLLRVARRLLRQ